MEGMGDVVNFNAQEMDKLIEELHNPGTEVKAVSAPGYTKENIDKLMDLGTCDSNSSTTGDNDFKVSKADWEEMQKTMAASQVETKKLTSSLTAIRGELNKLKRPTKNPPEAELQPARKKKKVSLPKVQVDMSNRGKLMEDFPILKD